MIDLINRDELISSLKIACEDCHQRNCKFCDYFKIIEIVKNISSVDAIPMDEYLKVIKEKQSIINKLEEMNETQANNMKKLIGDRTK